MSPARTFPAETASVREARDFVAESLGGVADEQVEIILLATSELAANSVRHAGTDYAVRVDRTDDEVKVTVDDGGHGDPEVQDPGPFTPSGRGLLIVQELSDAWGASSTEGHNRVWFSMRLQAAGGGSSRGQEAGRSSERAWRRPRATEVVGPVERSRPHRHRPGPRLAHRR